jgi:hypothetical protein
MKRSLALLVTAALGLTGIACGANSATHSNSPPHTTAAAATGARPSTAPGGYSKDDGDNDFDDEASYHGTPANDDRGLLASYGPKASPAVARAVAGVVKRYYAASAAGDAATACSLLAASVAGGLAAQSQPSPDGGHTCAAAMSSLLAQQHKQLLGEDVSTMAVTAVHAKGTLGLAVLRFRTAPESEILVEREGHTWKIDALFGVYMT